MRVGGSALYSSVLFSLYLVLFIHHFVRCHYDRESSRCLFACDMRECHRAAAVFSNELYFSWYKEQKIKGFFGHSINIKATDINMTFKVPTLSFAADFLSMSGIKTTIPHRLHPSSTISGIFPKSQHFCAKEERTFIWAVAVIKSPLLWWKTL